MYTTHNAVTQPHPLPQHHMLAEHHIHTYTDSDILTPHAPYKKHYTIEREGGGGGGG